MRHTDLNPREQLAACADFLGWLDEDFNCGLRSAEDGLKLWRYALDHGDLPEMPDQWEPKDLRKAVGYNPWNKQEVYG